MTAAHPGAPLPSDPARRTAPLGPRDDAAGTAPLAPRGRAASLAGLPLAAGRS